MRSISMAGCRPAGVLALGMLALTACADVSAPTSSPPGAASYTVAPIHDERAALHELTRAFALALRDPGLRQRVKNDLRESRHTPEHKLALNRYLKGESGGILLAKASSETGRSRADLLALIQRVRPLEFYLPVPAHRESWRGGADLLVASLLEDGSDTPEGFTLAGARVGLSSDLPPETPVLALVPVETDFSETLDRRYVNRNDRGGQTIGTYSTCDVNTDNCEDTGGGGPSTKPAGLYMTFSYIADLGEPWLKGAPEIEAHVHTYYIPGDLTTAKSLACAGEQASGWRYFDQNSHTWSGEVLLFTKAQIETANGLSNDGYNVMLWEDDDSPCELKLNNTTLGSTLRAIRDLVVAVSVFVIPTDPEIQARALVAAVYENASWLLSDDDWLGVAVDKRYTGDTFTDATHRLERRDDFTIGSPNGRVNLVRYGF